MSQQRGIDHLVLCVHDLGAACEAYRRFGFTTTPQAQHPFGTGNHLVQLQGNFLELLGVLAPADIPAPQPGHFNFAAHSVDFLAKREGLSMLVFESHNADVDRAAFAAGGLQTYAPAGFQRQAVLPDGQSVTVGFSMAFVTDPRAPEIAFFACQQHAPEHFWKPDYQRHANGGRVVSEVVMVAPDPPALADLFAGLQGAAAVRDTGDALAVDTGRGTVSVIRPQAFAERFGDAGIDNPPETPYFAGYAVAVPDVDATAAVLTDNGVAFRRADDRVQIAAADAFGIALEFAAVP
jgi:hypothetical protein